MARGRRYSRNSGGYSRYGNSSGREQARAHIEAARRLSIELGGTDADVKRYFFSLDGAALASLFDTYESKHGSKAREYAAETLPKWRAGTTQMSGLVAERLFALLPPIMPLEQKYKLTEGLWHHVGPSSKKTLRVGTEASVEQITQAIGEHIAQVVLSYKIPDALERRFNWLSAGDVEIKQALLNHIREQEKALAVLSANTNLPVLLEHLRSDQADMTKRIAQVLQIGKHELTVLLDKNATGVTFEEWRPIVNSNSQQSGDSKVILWIVMIVIALIVFISLRKR